MNWLLRMLRVVGGGGDFFRNHHT